MTETARFADVIFPGAAWAEKEGTLTNTERRVQRIKKAVRPPGDARADWELICLVARKANFSAFEYGATSEVFDEIVSLTPSYAGMTYERLGISGLQRPCSEKDHAGTAILHERGFARGKGLFHFIDYTPPPEASTDEYPFTLITGRLALQRHSGTMTRPYQAHEREADRSFVEINPADALNLGIESGDMLSVSNSRGELMVEALVSERVKQGRSSFLSTLWKSP